MKKNLKKILSITTLSTMLLTFPLTTYAGTWSQEGTAWKYKNDNGSLATGWNWIDGKSYFFDANGKMLVDTVTPDGYMVNKDGAWIVNGVVQTQNGTGAPVSGSTNYDSQYPLKGYMESWFVQSPVTGATAWKWDPSNFIYEADNHIKYVRDCAIRDNNPLYLFSPVGPELEVLAKLTGYQTTGLSYNSDKVERLTTEVRNFLNSFDWKNASGYEKAVQIAKRIRQADYLSDEGTEYSYGCLVEGKANCNGYTNAAYLLAACMGLPANGLGSANHIYPTFLVDGVWLAYEPTSKDDYFTIADVYAPSCILAGEPQMTPLGKFCEATGYKVPTNVDGKYPNISYGIIHGEQAPFIKFN